MEKRAFGPTALVDDRRWRATGPRILHDRLSDPGLTPAPVILCSWQLRAWQTADALAETLRALGREIAELRNTFTLAERELGSTANLPVARIEQALAADCHLSDQGVEPLNRAGLHMVGGHVNNHAGQRLLAKQGLLHL